MTGLGHFGLGCINFLIAVQNSPHWGSEFPSLRLKIPLIGARKSPLQGISDASSGHHVSEYNLPLLLYAQSVQMVRQAFQEVGIFQDMCRSCNSPLQFAAHAHTPWRNYGIIRGVLPMRRKSRRRGCGAAGRNPMRRENNVASKLQVVR